MSLIWLYTTGLIKFLRAAFRQCHSLVPGLCILVGKQTHPMMSCQCPSVGVQTPWHTYDSFLKLGCLPTWFCLTESGLYLIMRMFGPLL